MAKVQLAADGQHRFQQLLQPFLGPGQAAQLFGGLSQVIAQTQPQLLQTRSARRFRRLFLGSALRMVACPC
ncbi:hypothetical protein ACWCXB_31355 [Streptomyces sp. NPDC001514]